MKYYIITNKNDVQTNRQKRLHEKLHIQVINGFRHACLLESMQVLEKHFRPTRALLNTIKWCRLSGARVETYPKEKVESKKEVFQADGSTCFLFLLIGPHAAKDSRFQISYHNIKQ